MYAHRCGSSYCGGQGRCPKDGAAKAETIAPVTIAQCYDTAKDVVYVRAGACAFARTCGGGDFTVWKAVGSRTRV